MADSILTQIKSGTYIGKAVIDENEYNSAPYQRCTIVKEALRSPKHAFFKANSPSERTPALEFGCAFHTMLLQNEAFKSEVVAMPKFSGTGMMAAKAEWKKAHEGMTIVSEDDFADLIQMRDNVLAHPIASELLTGGTAEESFFWQDSETGVMCKARTDYLKTDGSMIVDLKSCIDARPDAFLRNNILNYGYDVQAAYYADAVAAVMGKATPSFIFIAVEKSAPFAVGVYQLDAFSVELGRQKYRKALAQIAECQTTGIWPSYPAQVITLSTPIYAQN